MLGVRALAVIAKVFEIRNERGNYELLFIEFYSYLVIQ